MCRICPLPTHTTIRLCASVLPALANLSAESIVSGKFYSGPVPWVLGTMTFRRRRGKVPVDAVTSAVCVCPRIHRWFRWENGAVESGAMKNGPSR